MKSRRAIDRARAFAVLTMRRDAPRAQPVNIDKISQMSGEPVLMKSGNNYNHAIFATKNSLQAYEYFVASPPKAMSTCRLARANDWAIDATFSTAPVGFGQLIVVAPAYGARGLPSVVVSAFLLDIAEFLHM